MRGMGPSSMGNSLSSSRSKGQTNRLRNKENIPLVLNVRRWCHFCLIASRTSFTNVVTSSGVYSWRITSLDANLNHKINARSCTLSNPKSIFVWVLHETGVRQTNHSISANGCFTVLCQSTVFFGEALMPCGVSGGQSKPCKHNISKRVKLGDMSYFACGCWKWG